MYSDPFYRQLIKVMQETGKETASTRQSSRYKDDLQANKNSAANLVKQKQKRRYKVEIPSNYSAAKIETMNRLIWAWKMQRLERVAMAKTARREYLKKRIEELKVSEAQVDVSMKPVDVQDSS
jgi:hypothetical protein